MTESEHSRSPIKWEHGGGGDSGSTGRARTASQGKRRMSGDMSGSSADRSDDPPSRGRSGSSQKDSQRNQGVEVYAIPVDSTRSPNVRAATSHSSKRSNGQGGTFPGILEAVDSAASLMGPAGDLPSAAPPRSAASRRRSRATPMDGTDPVATSHMKGLDSELTLEEFSSNARKELKYFDPSTLAELSKSSERRYSGDRGGEAAADASDSARRGSLQRGGSFKGPAKPTSSRNSSLREQRNTVVGTADALVEKSRKPLIQRGGSFKGSGGGGIKRGNSFKGAGRVSGDEGTYEKPMFQRTGSFRGGQSALQGVSNSKESQRQAHMSALRKQTSWTRASTVQSPKASPKDGAFSFLTRWKDHMLGNGPSGAVGPSPAEHDPPPAEDDRQPDGPRVRVYRESSQSNLTKQLDDSDYAGSNRPRDSIAPSERLKNSTGRRMSSTDKDGSESSAYGRLARGMETPDSSVVYPKPRSDKIDFHRFKLDEGQKALEKRLLISSAEAMHRYPGPHPETLNNARKKSPSFFSLMDGMSLITHNMVIGSRYDAEDLGALRKLGISYVLNITDRIPNYFPDVLIYHKIEIQDKPSVQLDEAFKSAAGFLQRVEANKGRVLIHCVAGVSRSVSIFLMYIMAFHHIKLSSLWNHLRTIRPYIGPNEGFCLQLALFEVEHLGALSVGKHISKHWDFYGLNSIISTLPKDYDAGSATEQLQLECCSIQ